MYISTDRNSAVELAQFGETILPPPELFDTERCCSSLGSDHSMFLLPPPAEFDNLSRASSTADLPLPPPPAFFDGGCGLPTTVAHHDELSSCPTSRAQCSESVETSKVVQRKAFETAGQKQDTGDVDVNVFNGVNDVAESDADREVTESTKDEHCSKPCNGVNHSSDAEMRSTSDSDETLLVPVSSPSSKPSVNSSQQARFARDVMDKLDELCRSQGPLNVNPPSSDAIAIPVHHETTSNAAGGGRIHHRRSIGQSWSDGLFVWNEDAGSDLTDSSSKRHSAGASLPEMVVSGSGARPKILFPQSRSAFDGLDWKRRPGVLRAQSAGVVSPHHQLAARRLFSRYTSEGREFSVHSEMRRVQVNEELRHRSLEPDDVQSCTTSKDDATMASVLSDSNLSALPSNVDKTRKFFSQQCLASTPGRTNLLDQASEWRKASRITPRLSLTSVPSSLTAEAETSEAAQKCDSDVQHSAADVSLTDEHIAGGRPVRVLGESSSDPDEPVTSQCLPMTSAERSMETIKVTRPPSLVVRTSTSEAGSPVHVLVAESPSYSHFEHNVRTVAAGTDAEDQARPSPYRHAPLCSPEASFDTASEAASGRVSPATTSVSTFQGNFSELAVTAGDDTTGAETSTTSTTAAERHFIVVAIDFGTTYSGYAFSFVRDPDSVHMMRRWEGGDPGVVNQKTPTTLLLDPVGKFHSFGYAARDSYHDLDTQEAKKWLYFDKFKMVLHHNAVSANHPVTLYVERKHITSECK